MRSSALSSITCGRAVRTSAPITGPSAASGAQIKQGAELAIKNINAAGGVLGQKLESTVGDDQSDPKQGVSVANKFVGDGVTWVVGHYNSGVTIPASEVYGDNGIVAITPAATNEKVLELIRKLKDQGTPVILITHVMPDVFAVADRVVVMHRGRKVTEKAAAATNATELVQYMVGALDDFRSLA